MRYRLLSCAGWLALGGTLTVSFMCGLYLAVPYLILLPLTGLVVRATHGGRRRRLLDDRPSEHQRVVVCTSSFNGTHWWLFYGGSRTVNSLLNKPLFRAGHNAGRARLYRYLLQALIAGQWAMAVGSCAWQDWNAIVVSAWLAFCGLTSGYLTRPEDCARDWLARDCHVVTTHVHAEFSSRRAMLGAIAYLNPDTAERRTSWINPILAPCAERSEWEASLLSYIEKGKPPSGRHLHASHDSFGFCSCWIPQPASLPACLCQAGRPFLGRTGKSIEPRLQAGL